MSSAIAQIFSFLGVVSIVSLLLALILLMHMIQQAFDRAGLIWGMIAVIYPPGTYLYCRKNWDVMRKRFMLISTLILISLVLWLVLRLFA